MILVPPPEREARLESRTPLNAGVRLATLQTQAGIEGTLARLQVSLDRFEAGQVKTLNALEETYDAKARRMRNVLADLGLDLSKIAPAPPPSARAPAARSCPPASPASRHSTASSTASGLRAGTSIA